jgi:hypothetical protein
MFRTARWTQPFRSVIALAVAATLAACGDSTSPLNPTTVSVVSGNNATLVAGSTSTSSLVVGVLDQNGGALAGVSVTWAISTGTGTLTSTTSVTDVNGQASNTFAPGSSAGSTTVTATVSGLTPVEFTLTTEMAAATSE